MGDFIIRLGILILGQVYENRELCLQIEYLPNSMTSNIHIIEDFMRHVMKDESVLRGFLVSDLKTLVKEEMGREQEKNFSVVVRIKDEQQKREMKWRDVMF